MYKSGFLQTPPEVGPTLGVVAIVVLLRGAVNSCGLVLNVTDIRKLSAWFYVECLSFVGGEDIDKGKGKKERFDHF